VEVDLMEHVDPNMW